jgi:hypothetical protein
MKKQTYIILGAILVGIACFFLYIGIGKIIFARVVSILFSSIDPYGKFPFFIAWGIKIIGIIFLVIGGVKILRQRNLLLNKSVSEKTRE